ncbi:hypothetical protein [Streptomyces sp. NPDC057280]|uniref:hypothetical protein n=1 Tax=Streptomyces sp. NPDC057280 TaxID=3346081 RepID=UPI0036288FA2
MLATEPAGRLTKVIARQVVGRSDEATRFGGAFGHRAVCGMRVFSQIAIVLRGPRQSVGDNLQLSSSLTAYKVTGVSVAYVPA